MMYPKMPKSTHKSMILPALDGGLNTSVPANLLEDHQLAQVTDMWWEQNRLATRPGVQAAGTATRVYDREASPEINTVHTKVFGHYNGKPAQLMYTQTTQFTPTRHNYCVQFYWLDSEGGLNPAGSMEYCGLAESGVCYDGYPGNIFVYKDTPKSGAGIFLLCSKKMFPAPQNATAILEPFTLFEFTADLQGLIKLGESAFYTPLVYVNGRGNRAEEAMLPVSQYPHAQRLEDFNMLTGRFHAMFTTDGVSNSFRLPVRELTGDGTTWVIYTDNKGGSRVWSIAADSTKSDVQLGVYVTLDRVDGLLSFFDDAGGDYAFELSKAGNNLLVETWKSDAVDASVVQGMRFGNWFADVQDAQNGGNRLFLAGNPELPNTISWSGCNQPLYFPQSNILQVGDAAQAVTAFARQGGKLVVFKEHSMYYTDFAKAPVYSRAEALAGRVPIPQTDAECMPLVQVHGEIGCDCPESIQLCFERLVWANTDKRVYVLVTPSNFAYANIYELSGSIRTQLESVSDAQLRRAFAINWNGRYILIAGNTQFVMNYGKQGFRYITAYASEQAAQRNISWYLWKIWPFAGFFRGGFSGGFAKAGHCVLSAQLQGITEQGNTVSYLQAFCLQGYLDAFLQWDAQAGECLVTKKEVASGFCTKLFEFGSPHIYKNLEQLYMGLVAADGKVKMTFLTDGGHAGGQQLYCSRPYGEGGPDYTEIVRVLPQANRIRCFGVQVTGAAYFAVDGMQFKYKLLGNCR